jgi:hypothetical protein
MDKFLQLALWNTNGLTQHTEELKTFISIHNIDFMLISEKHFTEKKLSATSQLCSLPYEPSSRNCSRWNCYNNKKYQQASSTKQL